MFNYFVKFLKKEQIAKRTKAFYFKKPPGFQFIAGQYLNWRINNPKETDEEGNRRFFSIAAAPHEQDLMLATRMRDTAFKRNLDKMQTGDEIEIFGPSGKLVLHDDPNIQAVFLTGGIGVTPFRSMILEVTHKKLPHKIFCFYSNRRLEDTPFLDDLIKAQLENSNFKLITTMTEMEKSSQDWVGERGMIDKELLQEYLMNLTNAIFYIAGPPGMVEAISKMLLENGVSEENIILENFTGY